MMLFFKQHATCFHCLAQFYVVLLLPTEMCMAGSPTMVH